MVRASGLATALIVAVFGLAAPLHAQTSKTPDEIVPNDGYGSGGTRTTSVEVRDGVKFTTYDFKDAKGVLRERHHIVEGPGGKKNTTNEWWDEKGRKTAENGMLTEEDGHKIISGGTFDGDQQLTGESWEEHAGGTFEHYVYNPATGKYELKGHSEPKKTPPVDETGHLSPPASPGATGTDLGVANSFYVGAGFVLEDSGHTFLTYGVDASYTHAFQRASDPRPEFGFMGDVQWTRGTDEGTTYTKLQALGGLEWCEHAWGRDMYFGAHLLAGISHVQSEYNSTQSYTGTSFALAVGFDAGKIINDHSDVQIRVDYNPTFRDGGASHNLRFSGGWRYRF